MFRSFFRRLRVHHLKAGVALLLLVSLVTVFVCQLKLFRGLKLSQVGLHAKCFAAFPSDLNPVFWTDYITRRLRAQDACTGRNLQDGVTLLMQYGTNTSSAGAMASRSMTSYCAIPKVACSFWTAVLRFLTNDTDGVHYSSPYQIPRSVIHYASFTKVLSHQNLSLVADDFRFLFVREPYGRLWSAYIDKFFLPDFWFSHGVNVLNHKNKSTHQDNGVKNTNKTIQDSVIKHKNITTLRDNVIKQKNIQVTPKPKLCPTPISFQDFVKYVVDSNPGSMNTHWRPMHLQCNPCLYRPHLIGKLETFPQDARAVLNCMDASWIMDIYDHKKHVESEILDLIDFNFMIAKRKQTKDCLSAEDIARRLWMSFKINGFIPEEVPVPTLPKGAALNHTVFQDLALKALRIGPKKTKAEMRQQKRKAMLDAYSTLSKDVMLAIQDIFWDDFHLFGYDPQPPELFARLKTVT